MTPEQDPAFRAASRIIDRHRAEEIRTLLGWEHGGCLGIENSRPDVEPISPEEDAAIRALWAELPGSSTFMDALFMLTRRARPRGSARRRCAARI